MSLAIAGALVRGLASAGVRDVVVCPGSRSAPLAVAAARCGALRIHSVVDERSAGFFALGLARVAGRPAAVICTSGTAGAHLYPAVIEASMAGVPLLAITADRPPELQHCAAPQTIDQRGLFGRFVRAELAAAASDSIASQRAAGRIAAQAVAASLGPAPGPVHINAPARKPLLGPEIEVIAPVPAPTIEAPRLSCTPAALADLVARVERSRRPLVCAGASPLAARRWRDAVFAAATAQSMPLLAEATSQLRLGAIAPEVPAISWFADTLLEPLAPALRPDLIIQIGVPSSAGLLRLCADPAIERVILSPHQLIDHDNGAAAIAVGDVAESAAAIAAALPFNLPSRRAMTAAWVEADRRPAESGAPLSGQRAIAAAVESLPPRSAIAIGNSLPVRWLDQAVAAGSVDHDVISQRGASGIDGLIAGAAGAAAAGDRPVCLICGDVSAAHDIGSLAVAAAQRAPLVLVILDNGGGRIFDELPYAASLSEPERALFTTPGAIDLEAAAAAWAIRACAVETAADLSNAVGQACRRAGPTLIRARLSASRRAILGAASRSDNP